MEITEVTFRAFDKTCKEYFADKNWEEIHARLMQICNTYVPIAIYKVVGTAEFYPLSNLTNLNNNV